MGIHIIMFQVQITRISCYFLECEQPVAAVFCCYLVAAQWRRRTGMAWSVGVLVDALAHHLQVALKPVIAKTHHCHGIALDGLAGLLDHGDLALIRELIESLVSLCVHEQRGHSTGQQQHDGADRPSSGLTGVTGMTLGKPDDRLVQPP